jgi:hypothetical protein
MKVKSKSKKKPTKPKHEILPRLQAEIATSPIISQPEESYTRIYHAVNPGDLVAAMGAVKKYYDITKRKVILSQSTQTLAAYYPGATHPTVNEQGQNVCCNVPMWEMLKPLIESQYYVHKFEQYNGQKVDLDFNIIRGKTNVNLPNGSIQGWLPLAFPDLSFDISKPWILLDDKDCPEYIAAQVNGKVILNFTERYRNHMIDYFYLKNYAPDLIFAGTEKEYWLFCNRWQLTIPRLEVNNFLDLAYAIKRARFLIGNQSMCINIAYAMQTPRVCEICNYAQNVIHMIGEECHGFMYQTGAEYYFRTLYNKTDGWFRTNK